MPPSTYWLWGGLIVGICLFTCFYNIGKMGISQVDEMTYAVYGRESADQWLWWLTGGNGAQFRALIDEHDGAFIGGGFKKPLHHVVLVAVGLVSDDVALGVRIWQAGCRLFVALVLLWWGAKIWGRAISLWAAAFWSINVGSAAVWRLGLAHGQAGLAVFLAACFYLAAHKVGGERRWLWFSCGLSLMAAVLTHMNTIPFAGAFILFELIRCAQLGWKTVRCSSGFIALGILAMYGLSEVWHGLHYLCLPMAEINALALRWPLTSTIGQWIAMSKPMGGMGGWPETPFSHRFYMYIFVPILAEGLPMAILTLLGIFAFRSRKYWDLQFLFPLALLLVSLWFYVFYLEKNNLEFRNLAAAFPFFSILAAVGAVHVSDRLRHRMMGWGLIGLAVAMSLWQLQNVLRLQSGQEEVVARLQADGIRRLYLRMWRPSDKISAMAYYGLEIEKLYEVPNSIPQGEAVAVYRQWLNEEQDQALQALGERCAYWTSRVEVPARYIEYISMRSLPASWLPPAGKDIRQRILQLYERRELVVVYGPLTIDAEFRRVFTP